MKKKLEVSVYPRKFSEIYCPICKGYKSHDLVDGKLVCISCKGKVKKK